MAAARAAATFPIPGQDYEVAAPITIEDAWRGTELDLNLSVPEYDEQGHACAAYRWCSRRASPKV